MVTLATELPSSSLSPSSSLFLKGFSFLMFHLLHEGAQEALKYSVPGITSSGTIQTCLFSVSLNLQRRVCLCRQRHKAIKAVFDSTQGSLQPLPDQLCIKQLLCAGHSEPSLGLKRKMKYVHPRWCRAGSQHGGIKALGLLWFFKFCLLNQSVVLQP